MGLKTSGSLRDRYERAKTLALVSIEKNGLELIPKDLPYYLRQAWIEDLNSINEDDHKLWNDLTKPSTLYSLSNEDWLNLWYASWIIGKQDSLPLPKHALNEKEQKSFNKYARELFERFDKFPDKLRLLKNCQHYELDADKIKQLAIKLIKLCSSSEQVSKLMETCQTSDLTTPVQKEILTYVKNPEYCDQDLVFYYLYPPQKNLSEQDRKLLDIFLKLPLKSKE